jgi:parallel beta-helix repeat protein
MRGNYIFNNKSGVKARDSEIVFTGNHVFNNINGTNFFRTTLTLENNNISNNLNEGIKIREGTTIVRENLINCNRSGLMVYNSFFGRFSRNVVSNNFQTGISLKESDNVDLSGNFIQGSGFNGINILDSGAVIKGNHISENGERGIGIHSFTGIITENSIVGNGLYAVENESSSDITAPMNWWGVGDTDKVIYDRSDDPGRGRVISSPAKTEPIVYSWPVRTVRADIRWQDSILIEDPVSFVSGSVLRIAPGTEVMFSKGVGMKISESKVMAEGEKERRIVFTLHNKEKESLWGEILLEHASGSVFSYADFEYASWALHSHFTDLKVMNSAFRNNDGGMRFRSGPVEISRSLFSENRIGLRAFMATALIKENEFKNNDTAIFVREKGAGLTIRNNNFHLNKDYSIRVGDFNLEDVDARDNWWGTDIPEETIFDGRREPGIGKVVFEPFSKEKLKK